MAEIKQLAASFKQITITHVPREQNKEADAICNLIMDRALKNTAFKPVLTSELPQKQAVTEEVKETKTNQTNKTDPKKLQPAIIKTKKVTKKAAPKKTEEKDPIFTKTPTKKKAKKPVKKIPVQLELFDKI